MNETITKHGVIIREHKNWNTKTIYNNGHVMRIYRHCPKVIYFKSLMVNDSNQHLCGGWHMSDIGDEKEALFQQITSGRKPFAIFCFWDKMEGRQKAIEWQEKLSPYNLITDIRNRHSKDMIFNVWDLFVCQDIHVGDIGDLDYLCEDYWEWGLEDEIFDNADKQLNILIKND